MNPKLSLDWIDILLFFVGFGLVVAGESVLSMRYGVHLGHGLLKDILPLLAFVPPFVRRMIWPPRVVREPKPGFLWSLLGIVGIFALLGGLLAAAVGFVMLQRATTGMPDTSEMHHAFVAGGIAAGLLALGALASHVRVTTRPIEADTGAKVDAPPT